MADFNIDEYLNKLRNPEEGVELDTVYDELRTAVTHEIDVREHKISQTVSEAQKNAAEVSRLKALNYDYMTAIPQTTTTDNDTDGEEDKPSGISSLFGK